MYNHLDFLNKNQFRKYPIYSYSNMKTIENINIPVGLITGMSVTTPLSTSNIYISFIYSLDNYINIVLSNNDTQKAIGSFSATVSQDFQSINLAPFDDAYSGMIVLGKMSEIASFQGSHFVDYNNGRIEESLIFCYTRPAVSKLTHNKQIGYGDIGIAGLNIKAINSGLNINLNVINTSSILTHKDLSSDLGNCKTPIITAINTVTPDSNGNIDIIGISPIVINVLSNIIQLTTGPFTLTDLCQEKNKRLPPDNTSNVYLDFLTTQSPEWKDW